MRAQRDRAQQKLAGFATEQVQKVSFAIGEPNFARGREREGEGLLPFGNGSKDDIPGVGIELALGHVPGIGEPDFSSLERLAWDGRQSRPRSPKLPSTEFPWPLHRGPTGSRENKASEVIVMWKNTKVLALVLVALVVLGTVGYVVYAQTAQTQTTSKSYLARVAEKLGVTEDALTQAMYEAKVEMIDEAVAEGKLTKAQADYLKAVLKAKLDYYKAEGYEKGFGFGPGFGMRGFGRGFGRGMRGFGPCWQAPATNGQ
jgi:hypothetical protein